MNGYKINIIKWGLGIGDWAQSPIPNPQSPFYYIIKYYDLIIKTKNNYIYYINNK